MKGTMQNNATTKTNKILSYLTYHHLTSFSMLDWLKVLKGTYKTAPVPGPTIFQNVDSVHLSNKIYGHSDKDYRKELLAMIWRKLPYWSTAFKIFAPLGDWRLNEFNGISFSLALPLLKVFEKNEEITAVIQQIYTGLIQLISSPNSVQRIPLASHMGITLWLAIDKSKTVYIFSTGKNVATLSRWLSFQLAFLLYNICPIINYYKPNKSMNLIWSGVTKKYKSTLAISPLHILNPGTINPPIWDSVLLEMANIYSQQSLATNNLYIWLQCISRHPLETPRLFTPLQESVWTTSLFEDKLRFVTALSHIDITWASIGAIMDQIHDQVYKNDNNNSND